MPNRPSQIPKPRTRSAAKIAVQPSQSIAQPEIPHLTPSLENSPTGDQEISIGTAAAMQEMQEQLQSMRDLVEAQQAQIVQLTSEVQLSRTTAQGSAPPHQQRTVLNSPSAAPTKIPQINSFTGTREEQTSTKVRAFIYNVKKVWKPGKMTEASMLDLADCYLRDRAATWVMNLEANDCKLETVRDLQLAMFKEFLPAGEKVRAKTRLMEHKLGKSVDWYVSTFRDLVEICRTTSSEAYLFFFNGLTDAFKEEFAKKYPTGEPTCLQDVYEHARTLEIAMQWNSKSTKRGTDRSGKTDKDRLSSKKYDRKDDTAKSKTKNKDKDALYWGPVGDGKRTVYRKNARCYDCGGNYTPSHTCPDTKGNGRAADDQDSPKE